MAKSRKIIEEQRKEIELISKERKKLLKYLLSDAKIIAGSYQELLVRCSRPDCICKKERCHPVTRLSWYENGKTRKHKIVKVDDRVMVKKHAGEYQIHKKAMGQLVKLNEKEKRSLQKIIEAKLEKYV